MSLRYSYNIVILLLWQSMKAPDLQEKLQESEKLIEEMSKTWEEKLQQTERIHKVRLVYSLLEFSLSLFSHWLNAKCCSGTKRVG